MAWNDLPLDELSRSPAPPLPGGYKVGEKLYYIGASQTWDDGDRLVHGEQGEVTGPGEWEGLLEIKFPNNKDTIGCPLDELSRSPPPPLPGGYKLGEKLYFIGASQTFDNGDRLVHGEQGEVMGPGTGKWEGTAGDQVPEQQGQHRLQARRCHARRRRRCLAATSSARSSITSEQARRSRAATASCTASRVR